MTAITLWVDSRLGEAGGKWPEASVGTNPSTVFHRLAALEHWLDTWLFDRQGGRHDATVAGADLLAAAERIEAEMNGLERRSSGRRITASGGNSIARVMMT